MHKDNGDRGYLFFLLVIIFMSIIFFFIYSILVAGDYKRGQVDAITGNIKYEKVTHEDETVTWEEIKGE